MKVNCCRLQKTKKMQNAQTFRNNGTRLGRKADTLQISPSYRHNSDQMKPNLPVLLWKQSGGPLPFCDFWTHKAGK